MSRGKLSENEVRFLRRLDSGNRGSMPIELLGPGLALLGFELVEDVTSHSMTSHELDYWLRCHITREEAKAGLYAIVSGGKGGLSVHTREEHMPRLQELLESIEAWPSIFNAKPAAGQCLRGNVTRGSRDLDVQWVVWGARRFDVLKGGQMVARFRRKPKDPEGYVTDKALWDFLYAPKGNLRARAKALLGDQTTSHRRKDDTGCGECAICENIQKLKPSPRPEHPEGTLVMVDHGFQLSGYNHTGERYNRCFGVGHQPYEKSREAIQLFLVHLEPQVDDAKANAAFWRGPDATKITRMTSFRPYKELVFTPEHPQWRQELERAQREADAHRDTLIRLQTKMKKRSADWKLALLPDEIRAAAKEKKEGA